MLTPNYKTAETVCHVAVNWCGKDGEGKCATVKSQTDILPSLVLTSAKEALRPGPCCVLTRLGHTF